MLFPNSPGPPTSVLPNQCGLQPSQAETGSNPRDPKSFSKKHKFDGVLSCFLSNQITMLWASPFSDTPSLKDPKHARLAMAESLWVQSAHGHLHCQCPEPACGTSKSSNMAGKSPINATKSAFKWENHPNRIGDFPASHVWLPGQTLSQNIQGASPEPVRARASTARNSWAQRSAHAGGPSMFPVPSGPTNWHISGKPWQFWEVKYDQTCWIPTGILREIKITSLTTPIVKHSQRLAKPRTCFSIEASWWKDLSAAQNTDLEHTCPWSDMDWSRNPAAFIDCEVLEALGLSFWYVQSC